ncbi:MAG: hypothetical protein Q8L39_04740 [Burkholderiales bacterium]|nr:hypothetical protein [Burkholderiales bacterium]
MNAEKKPWWKSRTLQFNAVVAGLAALELSAKLIQPYVPGNVYGYGVLLLTVGNAVLRIVTTQGLSK